MTLEVIFSSDPYPFRRGSHLWPSLQKMDLPCLCYDSGKRILRIIVDLQGRGSAPLDEILQLHQNIHLLDRGIRECLSCCTNGDIMASLVDGLATLSALYKAARNVYSETRGPELATCGTTFHMCSSIPFLPGPSNVPSNDTNELLHGFNGLATPGTAPNTTLSVVLGRIELTSFETNLVATTLIKQGLSQTGLQLRDLQQHLVKCLMAKKMERSNYDAHTRRVGEALNGIYSLLASI